jgi:hypothetical protein
MEKLHTLVTVENITPVVLTNLCGYRRGPVVLKFMSRENPDTVVTELDRDYDRPVRHVFSAAAGARRQDSAEKVLRMRLALAPQFSESYTQFVSGPY